MTTQQESPEDRAARAEAELQKLKSATAISGVQLILIVSFVPIVIVWLALAARMIWAATTNTDVLNNIEGLLAALAIMTNPVSAGMGYVFAAFVDEIKPRKDGTQ